MTVLNKNYQIIENYSYPVYSEIVGTFSHEEYQAWLEQQTAL